MPDWFIVNVAEARGRANPSQGTVIEFEERRGHFEDFGINLHVLEPGQPNGKYHRESVQEGFLVLFGEPIVLIDGEERRLRPWDFVHCPAGTDHIFVGAGDGPATILMAGARRADATIHYPVSELAARHGASVAHATDSPAEAYADRPAPWAPVEFEWPPTRPR